MKSGDQLAMVLASGVRFNGVYHHGASNPSFAGVVDAYPARLTGVQPGDFRVRVLASALPAVLSLGGNDTVVDSGSGAVFNVISAQNEFGGAGVCLQLRAAVTQSGGIAPPATSGSSGAAGQMVADSSYLYVCVASNTWKRVALNSW